MELLLLVGLNNALWAAGLVLVVAGLTVLCRRRPALVHGLWILVLVKFLVPSFYPIEIPGWYASAPPTTSSKPVTTQKDSDNLILAEMTPTDVEEPLPNAFAIDSPPSEAIDPPPVEDLQLHSLSPASTSGPGASEISWLHIVGLIWLTGSVTWAAVAGIRIIRFQRILKLARSASPEVNARVEELARRLGLSKCPQVTFVAAPIAPMLWALGREPRLLIPSHLWKRLTQDQRDTLLVHELAHLRRGDHWVRRLELLVLALYWWHPGVWWARQALREAEEECCDAWVVWALPRAGHSYAAALVETLDFLSHSRPLLPLGASGVEPMRFLKRRLAMIVRAQTPRAMSRWTVLAVVGLGAILLPLLPIPAHQPQSDQGNDESSQSTASQTPTPGAADQPAGGLPPGQPFRLEQTGLAPVQRYRAEEIGIASAQADRSEQIESARDQVELTQAKLMIKRAEVEEMNLRIRQAERNLTRLEELYKKGVIEESALNKARNEAELFPTQLPIKQAELAEAEILLKQATHRLQRLEAGEEAMHRLLKSGSVPSKPGAPGMRPTSPGKGPDSPSTGAPGTMSSRSRPGAGSTGSSMSAPGGSPGMRPGISSGGDASRPGPGMSPGGRTTGAPGSPGGPSPGKGMMGQQGMPGASSASGMMGGMGMPGASMMGGMGMPGASTRRGGMMGSAGGPGASMGVMGPGASAPSGGMMGGPPLPHDSVKEFPEDVQGMVLQTDAKTGLATISIGTDSGIKSGNKLEVYRLKPEPKYLGKIEILNAQANQAVGRMADGARWGSLEKGDLVAGKVIGKQPGIASTSPGNPPWADRLSKEKSWDFGTLQRGEKAAHSFQIMNPLKQPIHISGVRTSASFLKAFPIILVEGGARARETEAWISPYQSVDIETALDTSRFTGDRTAIIYVQFDQPASAEVKFQVHARSLESPFGKKGKPEAQEPKARILELEIKVDQLMKQIDALHNELKQQPGKQSGDSPTKGRPDGSDPAKH